MINDDYEIEMIECDRCNGVGWTEDSEVIKRYSIHRDICPKCQGKGILDWIEQVVGVTPIKGSSGSGPSKSSSSYNLLKKNKIQWKSDDKHYKKINKKNRQRNDSHHVRRTKQTRRSS